MYLNFHKPISRIIMGFLGVSLWFLAYLFVGIYLETQDTKLIVISVTSGVLFFLYGLYFNLAAVFHNWFDKGISHENT